MADIPRLTREERLAALEKAQRMRRERARIKARLKLGDMTLREVLANSDDEVMGGMRVSHLLQSLPGVGIVKTRKIMESIGISGSRRVRGLGTRQRRALLERFE